MVRIEKQIFTGKQNIPWKDVEQYLKRYIGKEYVVDKYGDVIHVPGIFPSEYASSRYSQKLRGGLAKTKANAAQIIGLLIGEADNRRYVENKDDKHSKEASKGWYRYDVHFTVKVQSENEETPRWNKYKGTLVVRINENGLFLHDLINIKKEARTPLEP